MQKPIPVDIQRWTEKYIGKIQTTRQFKGGISTSIYGLETAQGKYVLRVIDNDEWLAEESDLAVHEAMALQAVADAAVPSPQLIAYDDGVACSMPVVLSTWLPGQVVLAPDDLDSWLKELAETLAKIHQQTVADFNWTSKSWYSPEKFIIPDGTKHPELWRKALDLRSAQPLPQTKITLIHRDYHPANVLFEYGKVSGVVDWINACRGDVSVDLGGCRSDIVCLHGVAAANKMGRYYEIATGLKHHPLWDIEAILDFYDTSENVTSVLQSWHDLGRTDLNLELIYQRADEFLLDIMQRLNV